MRHHLRRAPLQQRLPEGSLRYQVRECGVSEETLERCPLQQAGEHSVVHHVRERFCSDQAVEGFILHQFREVRILAKPVKMKILCHSRLHLLGGTHSHRLFERIHTDQLGEHAVLAMVWKDRSDKSCTKDWSLESWAKEASFISSWNAWFLASDLNSLLSRMAWVATGAEPGVATSALFTCPSR